MGRENRKKKRARFAQKKAKERRASNGKRSIPIIGQHHGAKDVDAEVLDIKGLPMWMRYLTTSEKKKAAAFFLITSGYAQATDAQKGMSVEALEFARELAYLRKRVHVAFDADQTDDVVVTAVEAMTTGGVSFEESKALLARIIFDMRFKGAVKALLSAPSELMNAFHTQAEGKTDVDEEGLDALDRIVNPGKYEEATNIIKDSPLAKQRDQAMNENMEKTYGAEEDQDDGESEEGTDGPEVNEETEA